MHIQEFLCFVKHIISLWFGFSIIMLSDVCVLIINKINKIFIILNNKNQLQLININFHVIRQGRRCLRCVRRLWSNRD